MQDAKMDNGMSSAGSMLQLPVQSMPVNRSIAASTLGRDSGVQPQALAFLAAVGAVALGSLVAYGVEKLAHYVWPKL